MPKKKSSQDISQRREQPDLPLVARERVDAKKAESLQYVS